MSKRRFMLAAALLSTLMAAPLAQAQAPGWAKVRVGVEGNYPPFSKMGADGKVADFSDPYYDLPSRWVAKAGAFKDHSAASFKGKKIIVLRNSPRARHVAEHYKDSSVLLKKPEGKGFAQVGPTVRLDGGGGGDGVAFRKGDDALRLKVNDALKSIRADGSYKGLADKYFDLDVSGGT